MKMDSFLNPRTPDQYHNSLKTLVDQVEILTDALKRQKQNSTKIVDQMKSYELKQANISIDNLSNNYKQKSIEVEQLNLRITILQKALMDSTLKLQGSNADYVLLQSKVEQLENQVNQQQQTLQRQATEIEFLIQKEIKLIDQLNQLNQELQSKEDSSKKSDSTSAVSNQKDLENIVTALRKQVQDQRWEIETLQFSKKYQGEEWAKCRASLEYFKKENALLQKKSGDNSKTSKLHHSITQIKILQDFESNFPKIIKDKINEETVSLKRQLEEKDKTINYLQKLLDSNNQSIENDQFQNNNQFQGQYEEIYNQYQSLLGELQVKNQIIEELEKRLNQIKIQLREIEIREQALFREIFMFQEKTKQTSPQTLSQQITPRTSHQHLITHQQLNQRTLLSQDASHYFSPQPQSRVISNEQSQLNIGSQQTQRMIRSGVFQNKQMGTLPFQR